MRWLLVYMALGYGLAALELVKLHVLRREVPEGCGIGWVFVIVAWPLAVVFEVVRALRWLWGVASGRARGRVVEGE